jgi:L-ribulose-5-phosphate 3-epimerase
MSAFEIGVLVHLTHSDNLFSNVAKMGMQTCQLCCWNMSLYSKESAQKIKAQAEQSNVNITAVWAGWSGACVWDFIQGPTTLGIVPAEFRDMRIAQLKQGADFAKMIGVPAIITHLGFIPENPTDPQYPKIVEAVREIAQYCSDRGLEFWFESGQETPVTLRRLIEDVDMPNLGINFDTANVVLYGKGNPLDSAEIFGKYIKNLHAKDGLYPTNPRKLGLEVPIGQGKADFPAILKTLKKQGFNGEIIIEREISGPQQIQDIERSYAFLMQCLKDLHRSHPKTQTQRIYVKC